MLGFGEKWEVGDAGHNVEGRPCRAFSFPQSATEPHKTPFSNLGGLLNDGSS